MASGSRDRYGRKWAMKLSAASEPEDEDEEEVDETFLALQKLLKSLSVARGGQAQPQTAAAPTSAPAVMPAVTTETTGTPASNASEGGLATERQSREEILESRRQERERFRRYLLSRGAGGGSGSSRRRRPVYYCSEDDEEEDAPVPSVESAISSRFMNGSFSRSLNVHVINRDRWSNEEEVVERLPVVMLPKSGKVSSPADNPKLKVTMTDEHIDLHTQLLANLSAEEEQNKEAAQHYLKPPRSTWFIQSQHLETLQC
jgi:hypothetical protein